MKFVLIFGVMAAPVLADHYAISGSVQAGEPIPGLGKDGVFAEIAGFLETDGVCQICDRTEPGAGLLDLEFTVGDAFYTIQSSDDPELVTFDRGTLKLDNYLDSENLFVLMIAANGIELYPPSDTMNVAFGAISIEKVPEPSSFYLLSGVLLSASISRRARRAVARRRWAKQGSLQTHCLG